MIDLAGIRKKAKAQKNSGTGSLEIPVQRDASSLRDIAVQSASNPSAVPLSADVSSDALERLFSAQNALQPVNEEVYFHGLAGSKLQAVEKRREWLTFALGNENYALDIIGVEEIIKPRAIAGIPRVPEFVLGIISLRGVIVPIFDLKRRLRLGPAQLTSSSRIIICRRDDLIAGMLVDSINQVIRIAERQIEPPPAMLQDIDSDLVEGVGRHQGNFLILLNLDGILHVGGSIR